MTDGGHRSGNTERHRHADLRIAEIGEQALFKMAWPDQTDFYLATLHAGYGAQWNPKVLGPLALWRLFRDIRAGRYDLVAIHPPLYPFWHPRSFLAVLKFTVLRGHFAVFPRTLFSTMAYSLLRFLPDCRMVGIDMADNFGIPGHHFFLLDRAKRFFKRELPVDRWKVFFRTGHRSLPTRTFRSRKKWQRRLNAISPISLAILPDILDSARRVFGADKKTDLFFAGQVRDSSTVRSDGFATLEILKARGVVVDVPDKQIPFEEFHRRCSEAWLTWSPEGFGWDCVRHAEASLAGSVAVINSPTICRHQPLRNGEHCFFYFPDDSDGLENTIMDALKDKQQLKKMAMAARQHVNSHHTVEALCSHIADQVMDDQPPTR